MNNFKTTLIALCFSSVIVAQTDKLIAAFTKSIEQEKKEEFLPAIETMKGMTDTGSYETVMRLGWLYYKAGNTQKSLEYYKKAIDAKPNAIEPRYGFGYPAYLTDYNALVEQDKKILEIDPNNKLINGNLGSLYYYHQEYAKALPYFQKIVSLYPFEYENNLNLAWTYLHLEKNEEAEKHFNIVLLYSPKDKSALDGLTTLKKNAAGNEKLIDAFYRSYEFSEKSDYKGAIVPLKEVYDKTSYAINLRLGWLCYLAGLQTEAAAYYKTATELMPSAIEPKLGAVYPASVLGNKNDMKLYYEEVLKLDPLNTYTHYNLGLIDYYKKDYTSALAHFEKVVSLYPCDTDGLLMLGWTNLQMTKTAEAQAFFNKVLCFSPNNASALLGLKSKPESDGKKKAGF